MATTQMGERAEIMKETAKEKLYEGREKLSDTAERAKEKTYAAGEQLKEKATYTSEQAREKLHTTPRRYPDSMTDRETGGTTATFKESAKEKLSGAADAAENAGMQGKEMASNAVDQLREKTTLAAERVKESAANVKEKLSSSTQQATGTTTGAPGTQEKLSQVAHTAYEKAAAAGETISHAAQTVIEKAAPVTAVASEKLGQAAHIAKEAAVAGTATVAEKVSQAATYVKEKADAQVHEQRAAHERELPEAQKAAEGKFAHTAQYMKEAAVVGTATVAEKVGQAASYVKEKAEASATHDLVGDVKLTGRKIAVLAVDGFEELELDVPVLAMKAAGATVSILSLREGRIRGVNLHEPGRRVSVDRLLSSAHTSEFDCLFIPGGFISPDLLRQSELVRRFVNQFNNEGKPIASICHGPWVLVSAGVTRGRTMTSWPGIRDDMVNSGAIWLDQEIVRDRNLLTSRGPQDMVAFTKEILKFFSQGAQLDLQPQGSFSSPARNEPPELVIKTMKCLPHPSLRTALALGIVGLGIAAYMW